MSLCTHFRDALGPKRRFRMKSSNTTKMGHAVWVLAGLMLGGLFGETGTSLGAEHTWARKADMPTARFIHSASVVDGKIYVIGGQASEPGSEAIMAVEVYDPTMDSWTQKANIPTGLGYTSTAVGNGKIYVVGGTTELSMVFEYDPTMDSWTRKADLPESRWLHAASAVDGKVYVIGGGSSVTNPVGHSTVEVYDPATDTWTRKANMPFGVWGLCTTVVDGKIYALGGRPSWTAGPYVQEYDPATDTWTRKNNMPIGVSQMGSVVLGDKIIVIGGWLISNQSPYTAVQMYDPDTDIWTIEGDTPFLRATFSASVVNHRIYAIGGTDRPHPCPATSTVYELTVSGPPPDFNSDGVVDIKDLVRLIESWGQDDPLADIAPALGDNVVDVLDLAFLMKYWGQDANFIAHWKLDETGGDIAYDSAAQNNAQVMGDALWQRESGRVNGALQLDGVDDCLNAPFILDPTRQPFSAYVWTKGGQPGQTIISQQGGLAEWLSLDAAGALNSTLTFPLPAVTSDVVITDDQWHHIGLVSDGAGISLYVDDVEVVRSDTSPILPAYGDLQIGTGKNREPGTFWSGMIDDVRIYDRVVVP